MSISCELAGAHRRPRISDERGMPLFNVIPDRPCTALGKIKKGDIAASDCRKRRPRPISALLRKLAAARDIQAWC
jgi:hypothetical protein